MQHWAVAEPEEAAIPVVVDGDAVDLGAKAIESSESPIATRVAERSWASPKPTEKQSATLRWRPSLRLRLTGLFVLAATLLVSAGSLLLMNDQRRNADELVTRSLYKRIDQITATMQQTGKFPTTDSYGQIVSQIGVVVGLSPVLSDFSLLSPQQVNYVFNQGQLQIDTVLPALGTPGRLLAIKKSVRGTPMVVVAGSSLDLAEEARRRLILTLALGGPGLVLLLGLAGWLLSGAALRPVRRMTDEAASITRADTGRRLPLPNRQDEITHLGSTLNSMLDRLELSFRREQSFVDDASHELRTPLAVLRGELELAQIHPGDAAETQDTLRRALTEVERLSRLAEHLLVAARAGAAPLTAHVSCKVLQTSREVVARMSSEMSPSLTVSVTGEEATVGLDEASLSQIIENLVRNAARFATSSISIAVATSPDRVALAVSDDGPGFPPEFLSVAFERFAVADPARTKTPSSGTGIGLAIVRAVTERANGMVSAQNNDGVGATVTVVLPRLS
jgi:two-component system, OmpR family, sensor kinase